MSPIASYLRYEQKLHGAVQSVDAVANNGTSRMASYFCSSTRTAQAGDVAFLISIISH
jgi:hypothetical protein